MKALLVCHGTRGDVQPFLALAVALRQRGHHGLVAGPGSLARLAADHGVDFAGLDEGPIRLWDDPEVRRCVDAGYPGVRGKIAMAHTAGRIVALMADPLRDLGVVARACPNVDVVVHPPAVPAQHVAEMLGVPAVVAASQPGWVPTSAFPCPLVPLPRLPRMLNRGSYVVASAALRRYRGITDAWRASELGLPRRRGSHRLLRDATGKRRLVLQAFSPAAVPVDPAWPDSVRTTGFWYLPAAGSWTPPPALAQFLRDEPAPVYVGFGSRASDEAQRIGRLVAQAACRVGVRVVLATGRGGLDLTTYSDEVLVIEQAPHDWLFPRIAAVVHHGGAGTTGAALAAARPQVVCPSNADQPY